MSPIATAASTPAVRDGCSLSMVGRRHPPGRPSTLNAHSAGRHLAGQQSNHRCGSGSSIRQRPPASRTVPSGRAVRALFAQSGSVQSVASAAAAEANKKGGSQSLRTLHPAGPARTESRLQVSDGHEIYYRVYGNMDSDKVALFVHGGPGAGCWPNHSRFFDLDKWKVILVDQRGCGASKPKGVLKGNTTQALVGDFESLREHLDVQQWMLLGGSWGVTLALAYAQKYPDRVTGLILRGVCLMRDEEINWMFRGGAGALFPQGWQAFLSHLTEQERGDPLVAYYNRLTSADVSASAWGRWEMSVGGRVGSQLQVWNGSEWKSSSMLSSNPGQTPSPAPKELRKADGAARSANGKGTRPRRGGRGGRGRERGSDGSDEAATSIAARSSVDGMAEAMLRTGGGQALLTCHYSVNGAFLRDEPLLESIDAIRHIPCIMVQGRLDFVCPVRTAYDLHCAWPEAELRVVPEACHSMYDPNITHELVVAVERMEAVC